MSTKEEALAYITALATAKVATREEVDAAYTKGAGSPAADPLAHRLGIAEILYYLGGAIVVTGIAIFIGQNWELLSFPTKLAATLGSSLLAYVIATVFGRDERYEGLSAAFYLISALTMPVGLYIWLQEGRVGLDFRSLMTTISGVVFFVYLTSALLFRKTVLILFSIIFGTLFFYALTDQLVAGSATIKFWDFYEYRMLLSGVAYLLLGYYFTQGMRQRLGGILYGFGSLGFLGAALALGGWSPHQNVFWELMFPLLVFGALYLSVYLKSTSLLVFGTIFLMAYIFKITAEYFTQGLGWPLALVVAGLLMIAVGYTSVTINKNYIKQ